MTLQSHQKSVNSRLGHGQLRRFIRSHGLNLFLLYFFPWQAAGTQEKSDVIPIDLASGLFRAMENSHELIESAARIQAAKGRLDETYSHFFPKIQSDFSTGTYHDKRVEVGIFDPPQTSRDRNHYDMRLSLVQPLFSGFSSTSSVSAAKSEIKSLELLEEKDRNDVVLEFLRLYFGIQLQLLNLAAEDEIALLRQRQLQDIDNKFKYGRATELELLQAKYAVESQRPQILSLKGELEKNTLQFVQMIGLPFDQKFKLTDTLESVSKSASQTKLPSLQEAYQFAITHNHELLSMQADEFRLSKMGGSSASKHFPIVDLRLEANTTASRRDNIATSDTSSVGGMLTVTIPIFSGLSSFAEQKELKSRLLESNAKIDGYRKELLVLLNDNFLDWQVATEKIKAETINTELSTRSIENAENLYRAGRITLTEVLDSYAQKLRASTELSQAMYDQIRSLVALKSLMGLRPQILENDALNPMTSPK